MLNLNTSNNASANCDDKRSGDRKKISKSCRGVFNNGTRSFNGTLVSISLSGCRIQLSSDTEEFESFILKLIVSGLERPCKVAWRFNRFIGAEFITPKKAAKA